MDTPAKAQILLESFAQEIEKTHKALIAEENRIICWWPKDIYDARKTDLFTGDRISVKGFETKTYNTKKRQYHSLLNRLFDLMILIMSKHGFVCERSRHPDEYDIIKLPSLLVNGSVHEIYFNIYELYYQDYSPIPWTLETRQFFPVMLDSGWPKDVVLFMYNQIRHCTDPALF